MPFCSSEETTVQRRAQLHWVRSNPDENSLIYVNKNDMKISYKIIGVFLVISCLLIGVGLISLLSINDIKHKTKAILKHEIQENKGHVILNNQWQEFRFKLFKIFQLKLKNKSINSQKEDIFLLFEQVLISLNRQLSLHERIQKDLQEKKDKTKNDIQKLENLGEKIERIAGLIINLEKFNPAIERYFQILDENKLNEASEFLLTELEPYLTEKLDGSLKDDHESSLEELNQKINLIFEGINRKDLLIVVSVLMVLICALVLYSYLFESITKPINSLKEAASQIGEGNLNYQIDIKTNNEIGQLAKSFAQMTKGLKKVTVSKNYLNRILDSINDSLVVTDLDGNIQAVNKATCKLLHYAPTELIGKHLSIIFTESSSSLSELCLHSSLENYQTKYYTKGRVKIPILFSSSFIYSKPNLPFGIVCISKDITDKL